MNNDQQQKNINSIRVLVDDVFTAGKMDLIKDFVHPDFENHTAPEGMRDYNGFVKTVEFWRNSSSNFYVKVLRIFADNNDWVGAVNEFGGVHDKTTLFGIEPNGKQFTFTSVHAFRMEDGKMREQWVQTGLPEVLKSWAK